MESALKKGRETGCAPLTVAVLDAGGHLKAFAREDESGILRPQIAIGKAWGALGMGLGSRAFAKRIAEQPGAPSFFNALAAMSEGRVVPVPGGVLIRDASKCGDRRRRNLGRHVGQGRGVRAGRHRGRRPGRRYGLGC